MNTNTWSFVSAKDLVETMGDKSHRSDSWCPLISDDYQRAHDQHGILVAAIPRERYIPLLRIAFSKCGEVFQYNPDSLKSTQLQILVPPAQVTKIEQHLELVKFEVERKAREQERAEGRSKLRKQLISPIMELACKYHVEEELLLDCNDYPTEIFIALQRVDKKESFNRQELLQLRRSSCPYFAAAAHWQEWLASGDPWNVVHACSLLRRANTPRKAIKLLSTVDSSNWETTVASAFFTTKGGAERDSDFLVPAWSSAQTAISLRDDKPHPYLLLGALCYQQDRHEEGDSYFSKARQRGATDNDIEFAQKDANKRRYRTRDDNG